MAKNLVDEMQQVQMCIELIEMGARLQVLQTESDLSRSRLLKLFKEVRGDSPPKGMLPFSADWFMTWAPNIHSSLFYNIYSKVLEAVEFDRMTALIKAYRLYTEQMLLDEIEPLLSLTRAWTMVRFFESDILDVRNCTQCNCKFVVHAHEPAKGFLCGICNPPSRAGKPLREG
ncbi:MAG: flagellar transcriptional regulator FlhC [Gammaproteobacteria bacterium]|nr:MAG: flagellar transcriptional regulator FlhC [Gammaproteobacteria bacterium]